MLSVATLEQLIDIELSHQSDHDLPLIKDIRDTIALVVLQHGDVKSKADLDRLCDKIDVEIKGMNLLPSIGIRLAAIRRCVRSQVEIDQGWAPLFAGKEEKPTRGFEKAFNRIRQKFGQKPMLFLAGKQVLTPEELEQLFCIARELGTAALMDLISVLCGIPYTKETINDLNEKIGEYGPTGSPMGMGEAPVILLQDTRFAFLREMLRNRYRDTLFTEHYKKGGLDAVIEALAQARTKSDHPLQKEFIDELEGHFTDSEYLPHPSRLRPMIDGKSIPAMHQRAIVTDTKRQGSLLNADHMGLGKTLSAVATAEHLLETGEVDAVLVLCPSNTLNIWRKALSNEGYFADDPGAVIIPAKNNKCDDAARAGVWEKAKNAKYVVVTYERTRIKTQGKPHEQWIEELWADAPDQNPKRVLLICDEAHELRDIQGVESNTIFRISQMPAVERGKLLLLTGTPEGGSIEGFAYLIRLLYANRELPGLNGAGPAQLTLPQQDEDEEQREVDFSDTRSIIFTMTRFPQWARAAIAAKMRRLDADSSLSPEAPLTKEELRAELSPLLRVAYDSALEDPFYDGMLEKIHALRQICMEGKFEELLKAIELCLGEARNIPGHPGKIVIASSGAAKGVTRDHEGRKGPASDLQSYLAGRLQSHFEDIEVPGQGKVRVFILDGHDTGTEQLRDRQGSLLWDFDGSPLTKTSRIIAQFRDYKDGPAVLFTRTDVAGQGISLACAQYLINLSPYFIDATMRQMLHRLHRKGQQWPVKVLTLLFSNTVEEGMFTRSKKMAEILEKLMRGEPLTSQDLSTIDQELENLTDFGAIQQYTQSSRQYVAAVFRALFSRGKEYVRQFFARDDGAVGRRLAEKFFEVESTSLPGNNRRLQLAILEKLLPSLQGQFGERPLKLANIGCGPLRLEKALAGNPNFSCFSSDISEAMLAVGCRDIVPPPKPGQVAECAMDELPYTDGSKQVAIHSLVLDCAKHNKKEKKKGGTERVTALCEFNRILAVGGVGLLSLHPAIFENDPEQRKFHTLCNVFERCFGFEIIREYTGRAESTDNPDETTFQSYIWTLRKRGPASPELLTAADWDILRLAAPKDKVKGTKRKPTLRDLTEVNDEGAFHREFKIGSSRLRCDTVDVEEEQSLTREKTEVISIGQRIKDLRQQYGSVDDIPLEMLLSISPEEISKVRQDEKNAYFKLLLEKYHGDIFRIPLDQISRQSSVVIVRQQSKKRGTCLTLARIDARGNARPSGKRYYAPRKADGKQTESVEDDA